VRFRTEIKWFKLGFSSSVLKTVMNFLAGLNDVVFGEGNEPSCSLKAEIVLIRWVIISC
jgi:hypothetical protein